MLETIRTWLTNHPVIHGCVIYMLVGYILTFILFAYTERKYKDEPTHPQKMSFFEKLILYTIMSTLMAAAWVVVFPLIVILEIRKRTSSGDDNVDRT